jgi:hypothetical protein
MARRSSAIEEERSIAADEAAQEKGHGPAPRVHTLAPAYIRAVHGDTGIAVVFVPGEALPDLVATRLSELVDTDDPRVKVLP